MLSSLFEMFENGNYTVWRIMISYSGTELSVELTCGIWQMWPCANVLCQPNLARVKDWRQLIFAEQVSEIWLMAAIKKSYQPRSLFQRCGVKEYWMKHLHFDPSSAINHFCVLGQVALPFGSLVLPVRWDLQTPSHSRSLPGPGLCNFMLIRKAAT